MYLKDLFKHNPRIQVLTKRSIWKSELILGRKVDLLLLQLFTILYFHNVKIVQVIYQKFNTIQIRF